MGVPKKRTSSAKRDQRRSHWKITAPNVTRCPKCQEPVMAHRACPSCGVYKDRQVIEVEA